eukprot:TRINITY_DN5414_c0_g1_i1.p1 TRINITY_DN5414_c0_g1~~TRINITY_DN5414_c0_g1_i1.p1  ORF type:complete len:617 (-),score=137.67 TRINITY_DN5414_c0_g1_i1:255-2045(-)
MEKDGVWRCNYNAEDGSGEGLDPITTLPLLGTHARHPWVVTPTGTVVCYNEKTLRQIAENRGGWKQPPYFREPMEQELVEKCENIGGPLHAQPVAANEIVPITYALGHVIPDEKVSQQDVYVCPFCFHKLAKANAPVSDPLNVVLSRGLDCTSAFLFLTRIEWSSHINERHQRQKIETALAEEYKLKHRYIYAWLSKDPQAECYRNQSISFGSWSAGKRTHRTAQSPQVSLRTYWNTDGRSNATAYNRICSRLASHCAGDEVTPLSDDDTADDSGVSDVSDDNASAGGGGSSPSGASTDSFVVSDSEVVYTKEKKKKKRKKHKKHEVCRKRKGADDSSEDSAEANGGTKAETEGADDEKESEAGAEEEEVHSPRLKKKRSNLDISRDSADESEGKKTPERGASSADKTKRGAPVAAEGSAPEAPPLKRKRLLRKTHVITDDLDTLDDTDSTVSRLVLPPSPLLPAAAPAPASGPAPAPAPEPAPAPALESAPYPAPEPAPPPAPAPPPTPQSTRGVQHCGVTPAVARLKVTESLLANDVYGRLSDDEDVLVSVPAAEAPAQQWDDGSPIATLLAAVFGGKPVLLRDRCAYPRLFRP